MLAGIQESGSFPPRHPLTTATQPQLRIANTRLAPPRPAPRPHTLPQTRVHKELARLDSTPRKITSRGTFTRRLRLEGAVGCLGAHPDYLLVRVLVHLHRGHGFFHVPQHHIQVLVVRLPPTGQSKTKRRRANRRRKLTRGKRWWKMDKIAMTLKSGTPVENERSGGALQPRKRGEKKRVSFAVAFVWFRRSVEACLHD